MATSTLVFAVVIVVVLGLTLWVAVARGLSGSPTPIGDAEIITNSIGMKLVLIPAGEFLMGDNEGGDYQKPAHRVRITKPFYLGLTQVTQEQYERIMDFVPGRFKDNPQHPVEGVSWRIAVAFCRKLSQKERKTYRLPTEAEWEYACRAGSTSRYCFGDSESQLRKYAWYEDNSGNTTRAVGRKKPNAWGLYDMHGNVNEWCYDWFGGDYYSSSPSSDPTGPSSGAYRVLRGGGWYSPAGRCRCAYRYQEVPHFQFQPFGFRVCLVQVD